MVCAGVVAYRTDHISPYRVKDCMERYLLWVGNPPPNNLQVSGISDTTCNIYCAYN